MTDDTTTGTRAASRRLDLGLVFAGGAVGTGIRMLVVAALPPGGLPVAALTVNLVGALLIGVLLETLARRGEETARRRRIRLLVATGLLGGLTTYSALATDAVLLATGSYGPHGAGDSGEAIAYAAGSVLAGVALTAAGVWVGTRLGADRREPDPSAPPSSDSTPTLPTPGRP